MLSSVFIDRRIEGFTLNPEFVAKGEEHPGVGKGDFMVESVIASIDRRLRHGAAHDNNRRPAGRPCRGNEK